MRTYDLTPFYRSSVGFDRMLDLLGAPARIEQNEDGPPYDIERLGEDRYRVTISVPGFGLDEMSVVAEPNALLVEGQKRGDGDKRVFLHRGIVLKSFRRRFDLADFVRVEGASCSHGLLSIDLEREIPDAMKPRRIEVSAGADKEPEMERADEARA